MLFCFDTCLGLLESNRIGVCSLPLEVDAQTKLQLRNTEVGNGIISVTQTLNCGGKHSIIVLFKYLSKFSCRICNNTINTRRNHSAYEIELTAIRHNSILASEGFS